MVNSRSVLCIFGRCCLWPWPLNPRPWKHNQFAARLWKMSMKVYVKLGATYLKSNGIRECRWFVYVLLTFGVARYTRLWELLAGWGGWGPLKTGRIINISASHCTNLLKFGKSVHYGFRKLQNSQNTPVKFSMAGGTEMGNCDILAFSGAFW